MPELLLELFSEEIPARMQARAADDLRRLVTERLKAASLGFERAEAYVTPRRLALVVDGLPEKQPDVTEERRGPRVDAPDKAIQGFLKGNGLTLDQCEKRDTGKGEFWFAVIHERGKETEEILKHLLFDAFTSVRWAKAMKWGENHIRWVRPVHRILGIFDGKEMEGAIRLGRGEPGRTSGGFSSHRSMVPRPDEPPEIQENFLFYENVTSGHRFHAPQEFTVKNFADYEKKLRKARVILDREERKRIIAQRAAELATAEKLSVKDDPALLDEVAGLVEWPVPLIGSIDAAFMGLPAEVLETAMRTHQKYFSLLEADGAMAPRFVVVANIEADDGGAEIVAGNERVLRARLADARFFWDQDRKVRLEERVPELDHIIFHARLGTLGEKIARVQTLAAELSEFIPDCDRDLARSAALLAKADLTTQMVGEFPELQGVMGRYYALDEGERPAVADAIAQHYSPQGPGDACPTAPVSVAVALADKIDTLVGFFAIDEKPTGSRDPFALRRAALGVIRLIIENGLRLSLATAFEAAGNLYGSGSSPLAWDRDRVVGDLLDFFADRLKVHLREKGVRHDLIGAVFALGGEDDLVRLLARVEALESFLATDDGTNLLVAYKRASNIVNIEEKRDKASYDGAVRGDLLRLDEESALSRHIEQSTEGATAAIGFENYVEAMAAMATLRKPVDAFFDHVTVNCDEPDLRSNRLRLLSRFRTTLGGIADFSQIEG